MKKLIIAACAMASAAVVHAAACNWDFQTTTPVYAAYNGTIGTPYTGSYATGASAYLIYFEDGGDGVSQGDLLTALRQGKTIQEAAGDYLFSGNGTVGADGMVAKVSVNDRGNNFDDGGTLSSFYMAVLTEDGKNVYLTSEDYYSWSEQFGGDATMSTGTSVNLRDTDTKTAYGSAGWYAVQSVPEPTSGLLLLLGGAGLALRRRRA